MIREAARQLSPRHCGRKASKGIGTAGQGHVAAEAISEKNQDMYTGIGLSAALSHCCVALQHIIINVKLISKRTGFKLVRQHKQCSAIPIPPHVSDGFSPFLLRHIKLKK